MWLDGITQAETLGQQAALATDGPAAAGTIRTGGG
ncbi:hypothetical protein YPPY56_3796, partial [Yersinia pestis PY-56]